MNALIKEYNHGYSMLTEAIEGLSEEELRFQPAPDKWSIHQIIVHVADSDLVSTARMKKVLSEDKPLLMTVEQDSWARNLRYDELDLEQHLLLFKLLRTNMDHIMTHLQAEQFERVGVYPDGSRFSFKQLLEYRVQHVRGHLAQIKRIKEQLQN